LVRLQEIRKKSNESGEVGDMNEPNIARKNNGMATLEAI
jgi:hypothetical protein